MFMNNILALITTLLILQLNLLTYYQYYSTY